MGRTPPTDLGIAVPLPVTEMPPAPQPKVIPAGPIQSKMTPSGTVPGTSIPEKEAYGK